METETKREKIGRTGALVSVLVMIAFEVLPILLSGWGVSSLIYYTELSNLFALAAALTALVLFALAARKRIPAFPAWAEALRFSAACCLTMTLLTVLFVLIPTLDVPPLSLFERHLLFLHLLAPLAAIAGLLFPFAKLPKRAMLWGMAPTWLYGAVSTVLNIAGVLRGPYPFLLVYEQPVWMSVFWFAVLIGGNALIVFGLLLIARAAEKRSGLL